MIKRVFDYSLQHTLEDAILFYILHLIVGGILAFLITVILYFSLGEDTFQ
jgi:hypothetical protein